MPGARTRPSSPTVPGLVQAPQTTEAFRRGFDLVANLLGATLGPLPSVVMDQAHAGHMPEALEDAPTIVRRIVEIEDRPADVGAMFLRNLVWRMEESVGDGGATAAVLAQALFREALLLAEAGASRVPLAEGMRLAADGIAEALRTQSRPVQTEDQLARVAYCVTGDRAIATMVGEMRYVMEPDAVMDLEDHYGRILESRYYPHATLKIQPAAYAHGQAAQDRRLRMEDCLVAAVDEKIDDSDDMLAILTAAIHRRKRNLLILARGFSETVLAWLSLNHQNDGGPISVAGAVYEPTASENDSPYEDLACLTGARVLALPHTKPVSKVSQEDLGEVDCMDMEREWVRLTPCPDRHGAIRRYARQLRQKRDRLEDGDPSHTWLRRRIGTMDLGTGQIRVGADTDVEREWIKRILRRGLKSVGLARLHGVVPGGGYGLAGAALAVPQTCENHPEVKLGYACALRAFRMPALRILSNARHEAPALILDRMQSSDFTQVFDVRRGVPVEPFAAGLVDPLPVVQKAVRVAAHGAATALTIDTMVLRRNPPRMAAP